MNAPKTYTDSISVPSLVTDTVDRLSVPGMAKLFEELAWQHARRLGVDFTEGTEFFWVLSRMRVRVHRLPSWSEQIHLETWPSGIKRLFACREFRIRDRDGIDLILGTSRWLVMQAGTGRPVPPDRAFDPALIPATPASLDEEPEKLSADGEAEPQNRLSVRYSDLDRNRHTNNTRYLVWMLDSLAPEVHESRMIRDFDLNFTAESHFGDTLLVHAPPLGDDNSFRPYVVRERDGATVALGRFAFLPQEGGS